MAKAYWFQRIADPDQVIRRATTPVTDRRVRYVTAARASGLFQDEPEVLGAFINANVPFSVAHRTMAELSKVKTGQQKNLYDNANIAPELRPKAVREASQAVPNALNILNRPQSFRQTGGDVKGVSRPTSLWGHLANIGSETVSGLGSALSAVASPITAPLAAGSAMPDTNQESWLKNNQVIQSIPVVGQMGVALGEGVMDFAKGVNSMFGGRDLTATQAEQMRGAGYDPTSGVSEFAYYYQDFNGKRKPIADNDRDRLKNRYEPNKVDLAIELATSGYFEDPVKGMGGLSPAAQEFAHSLASSPAGSPDSNLIKEVNDNATLSFGGALANRFDMELGSGKRAAVAVFGDLAVYWFADPVVLGAKGYQSVKYAMHGVSANSIDDTIRMLAASGDNFAPKGSAAKGLDDAMRSADKAFLLQSDGRMAEAAKLTEGFRRNHPDMMPLFDALMTTRSGAVTRIRPRAGQEILSETDEARKAQRLQQSWTYDSGEVGKATPVWKLSDHPDEAVSLETAAHTRAQLADDLGEFVFLEALASGRPIYKGKMLLPGQVSVNRKFRGAFQAVRDVYSRQDRKFFRMLDDTRGKHAVELDDDVLADAYGRAEILTDPASAAWVKENYYGSLGSPTLGLSKALGRSWKYFEKSFSGKTINFDSPQSTELFRQWAVQFLPKRHAYALTNEFAMSNPARRFALIQQTINASLSAAGLRQTAGARRQAEQLLKGFSSRADEAGRAGSPLEVYTTPANNAIKIGDYDVASALYPYQLSEGTKMPNLRELKRVLNRTSVLGYASGALNNDYADMVTSTWKVLMVANPSNMVRQALEAWMVTGATAPGVLGDAAKVRAALKTTRGVATREGHQLEKLAGKLEDVVDEPTLARLDESIRTGNTSEYSAIIRNALESQGIKGRHADILTRLGETVDIRSMAPGPIRKPFLAMVGPIDWYRKVRAQAANRMGLPIETLMESPFEQYLAESTINQFTESMLHAGGAAADNYVLGSERLSDTVLDSTTELLNKGFGVRTPRVKNAYQWTSDYSTQSWAESIQQLQADPIGSLVARRVAMEEVGKTKALENLAKMLDAAAAKGAVVNNIHLPNNAGMVEARRMFADEEFASRVAKGMTEDEAKAEVLALSRYSPDALESPAGFAAHLIGADELGRPLRDMAKRSNYTASGRFVETAEDKAEAIGNHANAMVADVVDRLGGKMIGGRITFPPQHREFLEKVAEGKPITASDLTKIDDEGRPNGLIKDLFVADLGSNKPNARRRLVQMMSKAYGAVVAKPLAHLATHPIMIAHRRQAYAELEPVLAQLTERGMSVEQAAYLLESAANRRALGLTFNAVDNPADHTSFAELTDGFLMFNRAQEDFIRRFMRVTRADPSVLARTKLLVDAAHHSGVVSVQRFTDDEGNSDEQLVFTYPGSGAMVKVLGDAWASLGGDRNKLSAMPQFRGLSSQVRFINPSINNPIQFSANPILGMPLRATRAMFPEHAQDITEFLTFMEGGNRYFAEQDSLDQFLPPAFSRLVPVIMRDEKDGQYASALRTALVAADAAGILPEPGVASPDQIQDAQDAIRSMVQNVMIQRAAFGVFAPAAPSLMEPKIAENNAEAMAMGISSIRGEWFQVLEQQNQKHPTDGALALSSAYEEWARRYPKGKSIASPSAYQQGTSTMTGSRESAPSNSATTQWMMDNLDFVKENQAVVYQLLPALGDKWYEAAPYRLQFRQELREHKDLETFYRDVTLSDELSNFYTVAAQVKSAKLIDPAHATAIQKQFDNWSNDWDRLHPGARAELDRRSDPNFVHSALAPALGRVANGPVPPELAEVKPMLKSMYDDYLVYRKAFAEAPRNDKAAINGKYRDYGNAKWHGTAVEKLWKDLGKYEDS